MVSKVPEFDISKYQETGELGKHLDKSLLSGTSRNTTLKQDISTVIDNLVHNLMAICFQVETCVKSLAEGKIKWVNKEDLVKDLHNEIYGLFKSIGDTDKTKLNPDIYDVNYQNMVAIGKNLEKFKEIYEILQRAGVDSQTINDIRKMLDKTNTEYKNNLVIKKPVKPNVPGTKDDLSILKSNKKNLEKKSKTYEDAATADSSKLDKEYAKAKKFKNNEEELRKESKPDIPSKFTPAEAESLFSRKSSDFAKKNEFPPEKLPIGHPSREKAEREQRYGVKGDVQSTKKQLEAKAKEKKASSEGKISPEELIKGHPSRIGVAKQEKAELKSLIRSLEKKLTALERDKPKLKQVDENNKVLNLRVTPREARAEKERVLKNKAQIPEVKKQLEEAKALLVTKRADLRAQDNPDKVMKRRLKQEVKEAKEKETALKRQYQNSFAEGKTPAERGIIKKQRIAATEELMRKKEEYEKFKKN